MKLRKNAVIAICALICGACSDEYTIYSPVYSLERPDEYKGYELVWADEFDMDGLPNENNWTYEKGYIRNNEWQDYKEADLKHSRVENGKLIIEATVDPHMGINYWTGEPYEFGYSSASLTTQGKKSFQYGRIDIAARIPRGVSLWPAIWMRPAKNVNDAYVELDIMEHVWGWDEDHNTIYATIHTDNSWNGVKPGRSASTTSVSLDTKFHLYSIIWDKKRVQILFDNNVLVDYKKEKVFDEKDWNFDQPFSLKLNVAVGGDWGGRYGEDPSIFPKQMEVDYVRYYKKTLSDNGDDEEEKGDDEEETKNLIKNGNFETPYEENEKPLVTDRWRMDKKEVLKLLDRWAVINATGAQLFIDNTAGAKGTTKSLKYSIPSLNNWYSTDLIFPLQGVSQGRYTLSFYAKSKTSSFFALSATFSETQEDIELCYRNQKMMVVEDGKTVIKQNTTNQGDVYATMVEEVESSWKKYSITLDIPKNELVKFVIKPQTSGVVGTDKYDLVKPAEDVQFWLDEFTLVSGEGSDE